MPEVITAGETMIILNPDQSVPLEYAHSFTKQIGGAESNVAVGLSRLGHRAGWISRIGNDPFGNYVRQVIRGEGVDTSLVSVDHEAPTGVFFKERKSGNAVNVYYYRAGSAASRLDKSLLDRSYFKEARYVLVSGILPALSESCSEVTEELLKISREQNIPVVFDPNIRLKLWPDRQEAVTRLNHIAERSDIILIGQTEGWQLTGSYDEEEIAAFYRKKNPEVTVIVKLGAKGAYFSTPEESGTVPGYPVSEVIDPIGAGDAFAAGFLSACLKNAGMKEAVKYGNAAGAVTVQVSGDIEGFPREAELDAMIRQAEAETEGTVVEEVNR
ncbi:2-dehydro-3-deoxygluconokinase [Alteribacter lacisalsi]|uniref:2-dehydro-3-deoxygluconokinase n=1 Tax=Alteribacter lacisalsi TaxID=2045244 RepID=A0A2W0H3W2_9BACI|nr:2-dehydro-3-deoxygluconokinase [Alteribacter lacisalsi]